MDKPDQKDLAHLTKMLIEEGRHGGPEAVRQFIDHGGFDLVHYVDTFKPGWQLAVFHPIVYRRHVLWKKCSCELTPGTPEFWDLLLKEEGNLATAEFGRLDISLAERARLRIIRQSHGIDWWSFRSLVCSLGAKCEGQKLQLRVPPKLSLQVISGVRRAWVAISCYVVLGATVHLLARGCLDCTSAGAFMLAPTLLVVWWFLHACSSGWLNSCTRLRTLSVGR